MYYVLTDLTKLLGVLHFLIIQYNSFKGYELGKALAWVNLTLFSQLFPQETPENKLCILIGTLTQGIQMQCLSWSKTKNLFNNCMKSANLILSSYNNKW